MAESGVVELPVQVRARSGRRQILWSVRTERSEDLVGIQAQMVQCKPLIEQIAAFGPLIQRSNLRRDQFGGMERRYQRRATPPG